MKGSDVIIRETYGLVLSTILVSHLLARFAHILSKRWVNNQLLSNGVTSELPSKLVLPSGSLVVVLGVEDIVVVLLDLAVVLCDRVDDVLVHLFVGGHAGHTFHISGLDWCELTDYAGAGAWDAAWESTDGEHCE